MSETVLGFIKETVGESVMRDAIEKYRKKRKRGKEH
jgi:hypothetical protein